MNTKYRILCFINGIKYKLSEDDLFKINRQDHFTLWQWYDKLNSWGWPDELLPKDSDRYVHGGRRHLLMRAIEKKTGKKYLLWQHNKERMTMYEFEDFWQGNYLGNKAAYERYQQRSMEKAEEECKRLNLLNK